VFNQQFCVCLNEDIEFELANGNLTMKSIPLCNVHDLFVAEPFDAGFSEHVIEQIPVYKLDTSVGGARSPAGARRYEHQHP
jgi:hypothetical protein